MLALYEMEVHRKMSKLDYERLNIMVKRTIEQKIKTRDFQARNEREPDRSSVMESKGESRCCKKTRKMPSMESIRTVFKRRQL